jgi:hypothetical protein
MNPPYEAIEFIYKQAPEFAAAKAKRSQIELFLKSKKALLMKTALEMGYEAANAQEREAYANPEYMELVNGLAVAIEIEETLKWQLEAARLKVDIWRTESANARMEIKATE